MQLTEIKQNDILVFKLDGRLDSKTSPDFEEKISKAKDEGILEMIFDFENLDYISSAGLRVILKTTKDISRQGGKLFLCSMQDYVKEVFEIAGFDAFLPIAASLDDAMDKMK
jgi:anti-sigma B factor antagonist